MFGPQANAHMHPRPGCDTAYLAPEPLNGYAGRMTRLIDIMDRIRLRERFYGASHSVLARL